MSLSNHPVACLRDPDAFIAFMMSNNPDHWRRALDAESEALDGRLLGSSMFGRLLQAAQNSGVVNDNRWTALVGSILSEEQRAKIIMSKSIRDWNVDGHSGDGFVSLRRKAGHAGSHVIEVSQKGVILWKDDGDSATAVRVETDVVLGAIFRQAGIVDALEFLLLLAERDPTTNPMSAAAAKQIREAFGEALS